MPRVSVIMPVYNGDRYLISAIGSILRQDFNDFEFVIIDDASSDSTSEILSALKDRRVRVVRNERNLGIAESLNRSLAAVGCEYVVRMDADDWSYPFRIGRQVAFMDRNPGVGIAGGWVRFIGKYAGTVERRPTDPRCVQAFMILDNPLFHPSVIMRLEMIRKHGLRFDATFEQSEDFDLWERASHLMKIDNLDEILLKYRIHGKSITTSRWSEMDEQTCRILARGLNRIGLNPSSDELRFHRDVCHGNRLRSADEIEKAGRWLEKLMLANRRAGVFDVSGLNKAIQFVWYRLCLNSSNLGLAAWRARLRFRSEDSDAPLHAENLRFLAGIIWHVATGGRCA